MQVKKTAQNRDLTFQPAISPDFSQRITALRFLLAALVVFMHSPTTRFAAQISDEGTPLFADVTIWLFTDILGGAAVPLFFVISAYLFFAKPKNFPATAKSKFRGIVLPYVLWTALAILAYFAVQSFSFAEHGFFRPEFTIRNWGLVDFVKALIALPRNGVADPLIGQFWYLRNLLLLFAISPAIKVLAGKFPLAYFAVILTAAIFANLDIVHIPLRLCSSIFFYSLGFYAVRHIDRVLALLDSIRFRDFLAGFAIFSAARIFVLNAGLNGAGIVDFFVTLFTGFFLLKLAQIFTRNEQIFSALKSLAPFSFWIYASHSPIVISGFQRAIAKCIPTQGAFVLAQFFLTALSTISVLLFAGIVLKKFAPKVFALLSGGRL